MTHYQTAKLAGSDDCESDHGIVLDNFTILRFLKFLSEQTKDWLLSWYLETRTDRYLVLFPSGGVRLFKPDDVEVTWHDEEEYGCA